MISVRGLSIAIGFAVAVVFYSPPARAGVVVLSNHTDGKVACTLIHPDGRQTRHVLDRWEVVPVPVAATVDIVYRDGPQLRRRQLLADGIYDFNTDGDKLELVPPPIPGLPAVRATQEPPTDLKDKIFTIPVKILVDDKEPTVERIWKKRYRDRLNEASAIIERHCRVRFEAVAFAVWKSDDDARQTDQLIEEFDRKVDPAPARLAIGFTGHFANLRDDKHMGGTRGAFCPHILIREWGRAVADAERLEILIHELGHYLGASHSSEQRSVMRPDISDRQSRSRSFRIGFDARNTLVMSLVGEELRRRPLTGLYQLSPAAKNPLRAVYASLAASLPDDPASPHFLMLLGR
jgi:hypothetical protein